MFALAPVIPDVAGFDDLLQESLAEGHRMLLRFDESWRSGSNRFERPGETVLGLLDDRVLVGICGRNIDPYDINPRAGRVRHLYVGQSVRRRGAGRLLIAAILDGAATHFDYLNTNAPDTAFAFYERLGFAHLPGVDHVTHRITVG
ncbi:GNAT family N-acetyltransferase [Devosia lacusdianchii]|uniref:GNAT family N-acetyltransferase n=1 Tax=Devosia lacusdianchii TaxID=2917991 RepID=UPI001F06DA32|nr:GNAT family N-acetyltransferase [Devosia sp. JXJ CY 41]